jgi:hypothetical protein
MSATPFGEKKLLSHLLSGAYVSLHYDLPTESNEVGSEGYSRVPFGTADFENAEPTVAKNRVIIEFPVSHSQYSDFVRYWALWDAISGGNMMFIGSLDTPMEVTAGSVARFLPGDLKVRCQ